MRIRWPVGGDARMESRLRIRENALAPVLVMVPLGLLSVAVICDVCHALGGPGLIGTLAWCTVAAGLLGGTATALVVGIDELSGQRAGGWAATRGFLLDGAVLTVFAVVLLLRMRTPERTAGAGLLLVEILALGLAAAGGLARAARPSVRRPLPGAETVRLAQILDGPAER